MYEIIEKSYSLLFLGVLSLLYLVLSIAARILPCSVVNFFDVIAIAIVIIFPFVYPIMAFWSESYWFYLLAYTCMFILFAFIQKDCYQSNGGEIGFLAVPIFYLLGIAMSVTIYAGMVFFKRMFH